MIGKKNILIVLVLLLAFVAISVFKYWDHSNDSNTTNDTAKTDSIQKFWAYYNNATDFRLQGKIDSSIINYQEALKINLKHEDALYYLGTMFMNSDNDKQAEASWEKLIEINPQSERAFIQLGNLYFCTTHVDYFHPEKSKTFFERAANLNKETLSPNLKLGEIALFQNKLKDAFGIFNKISLMDHKNPEIFFIIGYLNWKSGDLPKATKNLGTTFELGVAAAALTEQGDKANTSKTEITIKKQDCDLFSNWLTQNLIIPKKYNLEFEVPKVYSDFDKYLKGMQVKLSKE